MPPFDTGVMAEVPYDAGVPAGVPFDPGAPALVLRLDRNPFHHGTLGAVRSLGRAGVEVHAVVESAASPVARSRHLRRAHVGPAGPIGPDALVDLLLRVSDRIGRRAVLIAMDDLSAIHTAARAPLLAARFHLPRQPPELPRLLADKAELAALCAAAGIAHPQTAVPSGPAEAADAVRRLGLPLVAKWTRPWLLPAAAGLRSTTLVRSPAAARRLSERAGAAGSRLLLQRYLPDAPDSDWFFHGCFTRGPSGAVCLLGGSGRKELSWPVRTGLTAKGSWQPNPEVEAAALRLVAHVGYRGILDLDFRRDPATGVHQLLDANPRPGAQFRLFTEPGGLDVVRALYLDLTGQRVVSGGGGPGRVFVAENYALLSALVGLRDLPARRSRPPGAVPRAGVETAWYAGDDLRPFLAMTRAWTGRGAAKAAHRLRAAARARRVRARPPSPRTGDAPTP
ncbi:ATP-grasp domain-containing protein [Streptomyces sp. NPDC020141]|uniref:ATP-grasp domain-containing protein n=1 Tax=Streptomyces sp. NPDC020141 TaxID=3365065 RepID=UPI003789C464